MHRMFLTGLVSMVSAAMLTSTASADLVAWYKLDETDGPTAFDSAGSGINGTLSNTGAAFVSGGISGNAISLNRDSGGLVNMGDNFGFTSGSFSLSFWLNTTTTANDTIAVGKHEAFSENGYIFVVNTTGGGGAANRATFVVSDLVGASPTSTSTVNDGQWHHVVGIYTPGGLQAIYVDGTPLEASRPSGDPMVAHTAAFMLGGINSFGSPEARYTGLLDEVQLYNHALSDSEIQFLFNNPGLAIPEPATLTLLGLGALAMLRRR